MYMVVNMLTGEILAKNLSMDGAVDVMRDFAANGYEHEMDVIEEIELADFFGDFA